MRLHGGDVWGHFAPLFHLVDVFAVYAITLVGGRHVLLPTFSPVQTLLAIGKWLYNFSTRCYTLGNTWDRKGSLRYH